MQGRPEVAEHEVFISTLLLTVSVKDNENTSGLYWLSSEPQCSRLTALLRNETFKQSLFNHPSFLAALCACTEEKSSALLCMIISSEGCDILMEFLEGRPEVVESAEFISALVGQQLPLSENELVNAPPLYWLSINGYGYNVLSILYKNEVFKTKLFASDFFESLVLLSPKRRNMSIFYLLSSNIPRALPILRESILSKVFEAWILDPANVQKLMEALFIDPTSSNGVGKICNAFSLLLAKGEYGRAIIERLLDFSGI